MEQKTIEKVLNQISEERLQDNQELRNLKAVQEKQHQSLEKDREQINLLNRNMETLKTENQTLLQRATAPIQQMEAFGAQIKEHAELLKKPLTQEIVHVHHVSSLLIATIVLFCIVISISVGWYQTGQRLSQYQNNDTKWRKLTLGASPLLTKIMQEVSDSVEQDPDKERKSVKAEEDHNMEVWNLQQKMKADSAKMRSLEPSLPHVGNSSSRADKKK
ncbi:MAG: hypothetical protein HYU71_08375 [Bacteroidetes bacterium]|nr:hypothetical protein [Bacteroidota bacterium]MDP3127015.1 hypothetical protein [Sediminibacterium sp.]